MQNLPPASVREAQIRAYAQSIGMDPDIAVQVARSEGLADNTWQGRSNLKYGREQSYGDFQLHAPPPNSGYSPGLGSAFKSQTGLDPSDPANWQAMNRFALDYAKKNGWGAWMGAKAKGITGMEGISGTPSAPSAPPMGTSMSGFAAGPTAVSARTAKLSDPNLAYPEDEEPDLLASAPKPAAPASKSPEEIYTEYLAALRGVNERRPQYTPLKLPALDNVRYDT